MRRQLGVLAQAQSTLEASAEQQISLNMATLKALHEQMSLVRGNLEAARGRTIAAPRPLTQACSSQ